MANYKVPRSVRVVDTLPLNASGKVLKYVLREQAGTQRPSEREAGGGAARRR
jgi:acyl-CoA synthetase (AMP-forming)/AMP-acid ligase II